jgi:hypothetical protein
VFRLVALTTHLSGKHRHFLLARFSHKSPRFCREVMSAGSLYCVRLLAHLPECLPVLVARRKREGVSLRRPCGTWRTSDLYIDRWVCCRGPLLQKVKISMKMGSGADEVHIPCGSLSKPWQCRYVECVSQ